MEISRSFPRTVRSLRAARHFVRSELSQRGLASWPAEVVVGELAANAHLHAQSAFNVTLSIDDVIRVAVRDSSQTMPAEREPSDTSGRGLMMVRALSIRWGSDLRADGKTVWATVPVSPADADAEIDELRRPGRRVGSSQTAG